MSRLAGSRKSWIIIAVIAVVVGAGFTYVLVDDDMSTPYTQTTSPSTANEDAQKTNEPASAENTTAGQYIDYSASALADANGRKWLFFYAPWCPQCRALESDIKSKGVPSGITILKVDYDSETSLKKKYGVTLQTTIVEVNDSGELVEKYVAYDDPTLDAVVKALGE